MCVKLDESDRAEPSVVDAMIAFTNQKQSDAKRWLGWQRESGGASESRLLLGAARKPPGAGEQRLG
jgi:hypothetical protein